jgi:hypothetical protein
VRIRAFVQDVWERGAQEPLPTVADVRAMFACLASLPLHNRPKADVLRIVHGAVPTAARIHTRDACTCALPLRLLPTPALPDGRAHHFWNCPVACSLVRAIHSFLPPGSAPITRWHLFLLQVPEGVGHATEWQAVAVCALSALTHAMNRKNAFTKHPTPTPTPEDCRRVLASITAHARSHFLAKLADACADGRLPAIWQALPHNTLRFFERDSPNHPWQPRLVPLGAAAAGP